MSRNASFRMLFALPLAFVMGACGGDLSADQMTNKPFDDGATQPVEPAPANPAGAIDLRPHSRGSGEVQAQYASSMTFSVSNTNNATVNTYNNSFYVWAGTTITLGTCGVAGGSGTGDTFLRLFDANGVEVATNDDGAGCGVLSTVSYTTSVSQSLTLRAGCYSTTACSGTIGISEARLMGSYSASNTSNAQLNSYDYVYTYMYPGYTYVIGTCGVPGASGSGDTYLRLFDPNGVQVAFNDDAGGSCGALSTITFSPSTYGAYKIRAGCYNDTACSGTVSVFLQ